MKILIIGGGIGGLCSAVSLQRLGRAVEVFDASPHFQPVGAGIGIGSNAMQALSEIGVGETVFANGYILKSMVFQNAYGKKLNSVDFTALGNNLNQQNITIHRAELHRTFLDSLLPETIRYGKKCVTVHQTSTGVTARFEDGTSASGDLLIAADGIHSKIRQQLIPNSAPRYAGYTCWRGITQNNGRVEEFVSREMWSVNGRFGLAPMKGGNIYWFACINTTARNTRYQQLSADAVANLFGHFPAVVPDLIKSTPEENLLHHDILDIRPLRRFVFNRIVLLGDAAHATTPNMGQGAGQAIEDAIVLANSLKRFPQLEEALSYYEQKRVARTGKVIRLSRQIGAAAQIQSRPLAASRDLLFPFLPSALLQRRLKFLYDVDLT